MHRAYVFDHNTEARPEDRDSADKVTVDEYLPGSGKIRCTHEACFQTLIPVRGDQVTHHWRHKHPPRGGYCPYYMAGGGAGATEWQSHRAALAEVHSALHKRLIEKHKWIKKIRLGWAGDERASLVDEWGAVVSIHAGNVEIRSESDYIDGRRVIPIVAEEDLEQLNRRSLRRYLKRILERQPVPVVRPAEEGEPGPWSLITSPDQTEPDRVMNLPRNAIPISIDARALFGTPDAEWPWPPEGLLPIWVWSESVGEEPYEEALDAVKTSLEQRHPLGIKVIRLLAKRLLVDGGALHRILFGQNREEAQNFFLVAETTFPRVKDILSPDELPPLEENAEHLTGLERIGRVQTYLKEIRTEGPRHFAEEERRERERIEKMTADLEKMKQTTQALEATIEGDRKKLKGELEATTEKLESKIETTTEELEEEIEAKGKTLKGEIEAATEKLESKIATTTEELEEEIEAKGKKLEEEIEATTEKLESKIVTTTKELKEEIEAKGKKLEEEIEEDHKNRNRKEQELFGKLDKVRWYGIVSSLVIGLPVLFLLGALLFRQPGDEKPKADGRGTVVRAEPPSDAETSSDRAAEAASETAQGQTASQTSGRAGKSVSGQAVLAGSGSSIESAQAQTPLLAVPGPDDPPGSATPGGVRGGATGSEAEPWTGESLNEETGDPQTAPTISEPRLEPQINEPLPPPSSSLGTLRIDFESERKKGDLIIYLGESSILTQTFSFEKRNLPGSVTEKLPVPAGELQLRVVVTLPRGGKAKTDNLSGKIAGGGELTLKIRLDKSKTLTANLG